jgi:hypothetical protein
MPGTIPAETPTPGPIAQFIGNGLTDGAFNFAFIAIGYAGAGLFNSTATAFGYGAAGTAALGAAASLGTWEALQL